MLRRFAPVTLASLLLSLAACSSSSDGGTETATPGAGGSGAGATSGTGATGGTGAGATGGKGAGATGGTGAGATGGTGAGATGGTGAGATGGTGTAGTGVGAGPGAGGSSAGTSSTGGSAGFNPGGDVTTYPAAFVPIMVPPGSESTQCITFPLSNAGPVLVRRFSTTLTQGTHHIILYRGGGMTENMTPTPCMGLSGLLQGSHPIFIAQQAHSELIMPTTTEGLPVALTLDPNEMVRMEMHFINTTAAPIMVDGTISMDTLDASKTPDGTWVKSDLAFWGTTQINIPAHSAGDTGVHFQKALEDTHTFALTTHEHHLGTSMKVWYGKSGDQSDMVANGTNWSDPPLHIFSPTLDFPAGQGLGYSYECQWQNDGDFAVKFGESVNDEMCFLWHYYYPSSGFQLCVDGFCQNK